MPVSKIITADRRWPRCCWRRSAPSRSTWRPSPRRSAWAAKRTPTRPALHRRGGLRRDLHRRSACSARAVIGVLTAFPRELVVAVAGLALLGTIGGGLAAALKDEAHREAALHHLPGHARRRHAGRHRLGLLGRGGRRAGAVCATVAAPRRAAEPDCLDPHHETALRRRPARSLQDLQGHHLRDDARGRARAATRCWPASRATWSGSAAAASTRTARDASR